MTSREGTKQSISSKKQNSINFYNDLYIISGKTYQPVSHGRFQVSTRKFPLGFYETRRLLNPFQFKKGEKPPTRETLSYFRELDKREYQKMLLENISIDFNQDKKEKDNNEKENKQEENKFQSPLKTPKKRKKTIPEDSGKGSSITPTDIFGSELSTIGNTLNEDVIIANKDSKSKLTQIAKQHGIKNLPTDKTELYETLLIRAKNNQKTNSMNK